MAEPSTPRDHATEGVVLSPFLRRGLLLAFTAAAATVAAVVAVGCGSGSGHARRTGSGDLLERAVSALNARVLADEEDDGLPFLLVSKPRRCAVGRDNPLYHRWVSVTVIGGDGGWLQANINPAGLNAGAAKRVQIIFGRGLQWRKDIVSPFRRGIPCTVTQQGLIRLDRH